MWTCSYCDGQTEDGFDICWTCRTPAGPTSADGSGRQKLIVTTTPTMTTHEVVEYLGPVFGETVLGANVLQDFAASITDAFGGRSSTYEDVLKRGRTEAIAEMTRSAERIGANAIVDLDVKYETIINNMFLVCATGTAVRVCPKELPSIDLHRKSHNSTFEPSEE